MGTGTENPFQMLKPMLNGERVFRMGSFFSAPCPSYCIHKETQRAMDITSLNQCSIYRKGPEGISVALLAQSVERETLTKQVQCISRLRVRPPREATGSLFFSSSAN